MARNPEHPETRAGKGSGRRPLKVSKEQFNKNWDQVFKKEKKNEKDRG